MRDGLGMVGGLTFSYFTSFLFDSYVKEFRLFADIINDLGLTLDMVAPYYPNHVLYITSLGTVCKIMCGIAAGATKGSITQHFCQRGNMADLNAKEGTQETLVSLIGMILGVLLARYLNRIEKDSGGPQLAATISWTIFIVLTLVHVWVNYIGVKLLHLKTLNQERAKVALRGVVAATVEQTLVSSGNKTSDWPKRAIVDTIPTPDGVSESLLASTWGMLFPSSVRLGTRLSDTFQGMTSVEAKQAVELFVNEKYILTVRRRKRIRCSLLVGAKDEDEWKAFLHIMVLRDCLSQSQSLDADVLVAR